MCGIYVTNINYDQKTTERKLKSIKFRGPDNTGYSKVNDISLAHLRLSIIDLDPRSNQPMELENFHIVYNGEIYNFKDIRQELAYLGYHFKTTSDTEVLLVGYKEWGANLVPKLNGMFAFCIYDALTEKLFGARDRLGVKPYYYYWKDGQFEICSQLRPLSEGKEISVEAISIYLDCGYIPSPYSIFKDVHKLSPGNTMLIDLQSQKLEIKEYWNLQKVVLSHISYDEAKIHLHDLLIDSVKIRLQSDVPIGSFLSGGIDSALISSIAAKVSIEPINTFTIGFKDPKYDESEVAAQFAKIIKSNHIETKCGPEDVLEMLPKLIEVYDEPFADSSALPSLLLNSITKQYATVALSGDGGDESFFGYNHFDSVSKFSSLEKIPLTLRKGILRVLSTLGRNDRFSHIAKVLKIDSRKDFIEAIFVGYNSLQLIRKKDWLLQYEKYESLSSNPLQQAADLNIKLWLDNDSNVKVDRASMAYSVEIRSPFLDYRIVEFARTLPVSFRYRKGRSKKILRDILKEYIPEKVFNQPKRGFAVPIGKWMRNELKGEILLHLTDDFLHFVPNLNIQLFKRMLLQHLNGEEDHTFPIWKLYILSKWLREFGFYKPNTKERETSSS